MSDRSMKLAGRTRTRKTEEPRSGGTLRFIPGETSPNGQSREESPAAEKKGWLEKGTAWVG